MSENVIPVSNTSIFDKLAAEYRAIGKSYESLVARPKLVNPWPTSVEGVRPSVQIADEHLGKQELPKRPVGASLGGLTELIGVVNAGMTSEEVVRNVNGFTSSLREPGLVSHDIHDDGSKPYVPRWVRTPRKLNLQKPDPVVMALKDAHAQTSLLEKPAAEEVILEDNVHQLDLENHYNGGWGQWLYDTIKKTAEDHPNHINQRVTVKGEFDGTTTVTITGVQKPEEIPTNWAYEAASQFYREHPNAIVEGTKLVQYGNDYKIVVDCVEPITSVGEDTPESLYMPSPAWANDEE
jgi:hypothetical protein